MAQPYKVSNVPQEYDQAWLVEELQRVSNAIVELETPQVLLTPQHVAPTKYKEGMVVYADGTDWNPGHGGGLYERNSVGWTPLFPLTTGIVTDRIHVGNTTTETTIYTNTIPANQLSVEECIRLNLAGYYDTGAASDTWTLRVKLGGTTLHTITRASANNAVNFGWELNMKGTARSIGASGTFVDSAVLFDELSIKTNNDPTVHTVDTTVDNDLVVTIQWALAKAANDFHLDQGFLEVLH